MQKEKLNRKNKGITLIALIITIIVMLILVGVSVTVALNGGLFSTAKTAKEGTQAERDKELALADGTVEMEYYKAKANGETTAGSIGEYILETKGLKIGDIVEYNPGEVGTGETDTHDTAKIENLGNWRVLGVNADGQVELISENPTEARMLIDNYKTGPEKLNEFCYDLYGHGTGAVKARSLNADDINKLVNFNPETDGNEGESYTIKYLDDWVLYILTENITDDNRNTAEGWSKMGYQSYTHEILGTIDKDNPGPIEIKNPIYYSYQYDEKNFPDIGEGLTMKDIIVGLNSSEEGPTQALASGTYKFNEGNFDTFIRYTNTTELNWHNLEMVNNLQLSIRPVVVLSSDFEF